MIEGIKEAALFTRTAPKWRVFLARVFGKRGEWSDIPGTVVTHTWRGKTYVTGWSFS